MGMYPEVTNNEGRIKENLEANYKKKKRKDLKNRAYY